MRAEAEKNNLKEKINDLNSRLSELNNSLRDKERTIQDLNKKLVSVLASSLHIKYFYKLQWLQWYISYFCNWIEYFCYKKFMSRSLVLTCT